ncbi:hypothetical protein RRG08_045893, partial [Elysia crispata]
ISRLGLPVEAYFYGGIYILAGFGLGLSYVVGSFTIVPLMYPPTSQVFTNILKLQASANLPFLYGCLSPFFELWGPLYTAIGGFKSVVWTDVFLQTIVICHRDVHHYH